MPFQFSGTTILYGAPASSPVSSAGAAVAAGTARTSAAAIAINIFFITVLSSLDGGPELGRAYDWAEAKATRMLRFGSAPAELESAQRPKRLKMYEDDP